MLGYFHITNAGWDRQAGRMAPECVVPRTRTVHAARELQRVSFPGRRAGDGEPAWVAALLHASLARRSAWRLQQHCGGGGHPRHCFPAGLGAL